MELCPDFRELLELFAELEIDYMIVGGYALAFYGAPRYTGDIDLLIRADRDNARRVIDALKQFGFGSVGIEESDFTKPDSIVQLGRPPARIDIMTSISGVTWEEASNHKVRGEVSGLTTYFISKDDFLANKRASGRTRDLADIEALEDAPDIDD